MMMMMVVCVVVGCCVVIVVFVVVDVIIMFVMCMKCDGVGRGDVVADGQRPVGVEIYDPPVAAAALELEAAQLEIDVVVDRHDVLGFDMMPARSGARGVTRQVHVGLGFHEEHVRVDQTCPRETPRTAVLLQLTRTAKELPLVARQALEHGVEEDDAFSDILERRHR